MHTGVVNGGFPNSYISQSGGLLYTVAPLCWTAVSSGLTATGQGAGASGRTCVAMLMLYTTTLSSRSPRWVLK